MPQIDLRIVQYGIVILIVLVLFMLIHHINKLYKRIDKLDLVVYSLCSALIDCLSKLKEAIPKENSTEPSETSEPQQE